MIYRILIKVADRPNNNSLYRYYKEEDTETSSVVWQTESLSNLDSKVEELLVNYKKSQIDVVVYGEYSVNAEIDEFEGEISGSIPTDLELNGNVITLKNRNGETIGSGVSINIGDFDYDDDNDGIVDLSTIGGTAPTPNDTENSRDGE